jgi:curved DNA-binding protein CbpA
LSLRWHPDRRTEQEQKKATERMAEINQANDILCNEVKRRFYDRWSVLPNEE